jgi:hypothetical protein
MKQEINSMDMAAIIAVVPSVIALYKLDQVWSNNEV